MPIEYPRADSPLEQGEENFIIQDLHEFHALIDEVEYQGERRQATKSEREKMDKNIEKLSELFEKADFNWSVDGALGISLLKGEYIGAHKDIDISLEHADLPRIEDYLQQRGYGLFLSYDADETDGKKAIAQRLTDKNMDKVKEYTCLVGAIDEAGRPRKEEILNFIEVHVIYRDEMNQRLGIHGAKLPRAWSQPQLIHYQGKDINISNPAATAYFKLSSNRRYDQADLQRLAETGLVSTADVKVIEKILENEIINQKQIMIDIFQTVDSAKLSEMKSADEIYNAIVGTSAIGSKLQEADRLLFSKLAEKIASSAKRTPEAIVEMLYELPEVQKNVMHKKDKATELQKWVKEKEDSLSPKERLHNIERIGNFLFHGSFGKFDYLEPRQAYHAVQGMEEFETHGEPGVFATDSADLAVFKAIMNGDNFPGKKLLMKYSSHNNQLHFATNQVISGDLTDKKGFVYILDREHFTKISDSEYKITSKIIPEDIISVSGNDLPSNINLI